MTQAVIRPANPGDLDALVDLLRMLFGIETDFDFAAARQRRGLAMLLAHETAVILVAETAGQVIGMCSGQLTISTAEGGFSLLVEDMVVAEPWQGRGIGRELLTTLEQWAASRKVGRLQLLADRNNTAALEFYRKLGWQPTELICQRRRL
ncbi:GNAT family N-acetyltransferase [Thiovibrio frasassiensis]|uniref:GNAT family N-acetyltransferase n=1 Tax=Thiovibrio frasassiensis TaxID=2984131 RepID=A0A9X4RKW2_9BACT|nr:GNAT family N-acetyltransferase [Thiovibrio frasassiensis]MDG4474950.1 GNAT family N-acetyltransferase [Thiovibrio frasassiensis]